MRLRPPLAPLLASLALAGSLAAAGPVNRTALSSLTLPSATPTTGYTLVDALPGLTFTQPIAVVAPPDGTGRLFVVEQPGRIWLVANPAASSPARELFLDLTDRVLAPGGSEEGLLSLAFHPNFAANGRFYVFYTGNAATAAGTGRHDILARFTLLSGNASRGDPASEQRLIVQYDQASNHNGAQLLFGPDGYLYATLGDEGGGDDGFGNSQRIDRDFFAGVIRLDVDRKPGNPAPNAHPAVVANTYAVPADNPWIGATSFNGLAVNPAAVRTEFWAVGLRNPWRGSFDPLTGEFWLGDVGQSAREEIDLIVRGANYGWNYREGLIPRPGSPPPPAGFTGTDPLIDLDRSLAFAVTGGVVYRGAKFSDLFGAYVFSDYGSGRVWTLRRPTGGGAPVRTQLLTEPGLACFLADPVTGDLYAADHDSGRIRKFAASTSGGSYPATLGATGAFTNVAQLQPAAGWVAYEPNLPFWSDHAEKRRWFGQTNLAAPFQYAAAGNWGLPAGAVWMKHFDLDLVRGDPASRRRIETRFLVRTAGGVYGLSYRWNDAQTDATLVGEAGEDAAFTVREGATTRTQTWRFPSRSECLTCHTPAAGWALSFNARQLNRTYAYAAGERNQLTALAEAGYLDRTPDTAAAPALVRPAETRHTLETRARSWLDANCSSCHQPGGMNAAGFDARASVPTAQTGLINGALFNNLGDAANRLVVPGDPEHSAILLRASRRGALQMPPIASHEIDPLGVILLREWIRRLGQDADTAESRLVALATRGVAENGQSVMIGGFVFRSDGPKKFLLRAGGPALAPFGVGNPVANPQLELFAGSASLATNDDWQTGPGTAEVSAVGAAVGAHPFVNGSRDAALVTTLNPGAYTVHVRGGTGGGSIALFEVFEAESTATGRLAAIATRLRLGAGERVAIPGLAVAGGTRRTFLVRAVGPGLIPFGLTDIVADPRLTVVRGSTPVASNDDWGQPDGAAAIVAASSATGAHPLAPGSKDAALLLTLDPGNYTVVVEGATAAEGVVLVEVFEVL